MYVTYVLENPLNKHYTGSTDNIDERLMMHNDVALEKARFHRTTYKKGPWQTIFVKEFSSRKEALEFERFLKTSPGRRWLKEFLNTETRATSSDG